VDIWTLGVILYEMLFRSNPFRITCQEELTNILNSPVAFEDCTVSDSAKEVIMACLNKKAADRPNIRELMLFEFVLRGHAADEFKR
jgi:serine/threonine protein kinase